MMTVKPGPRDSIIIAVVSLLVGAASAQLMLRSGPARETSSVVVQPGD